MIVSRVFSSWSLNAPVRRQYLISSHSGRHTPLFCGGAWQCPPCCHVSSCKSRV